MNSGEYFKIETVEELKQAYQMFKDQWWDRFKLSNEIYYFEEYSNYCTIVKDLDGDVTLKSEPFCSRFKEIPSPLKSKTRTPNDLKPETNLQKTLEIGDLNIKILKVLIANEIVDERLTGIKAQEIVDKIDELSRIILK